MEKASKIFMRVIFPLNVVAMLVSIYFYPQEIVKVIPLFFSCGIMILNVKVSRFGPLAGGINSLLYALSYSLLGLYGNAAYAALVSCPFQIVTFINWSKHPYKGSTVIKKLGAKKFSLVIAASAIAWVCLYLILGALGSSNAILDNTTTILGILSTVLFVFPFVEYAYISAISGVLTLFMYIRMIPENPEAITFLIFSVYSFISIILTLINVRRLYKEQRRQETAK